MAVGHGFGQKLKYTVFFECADVIGLLLGHWLAARCPEAHLANLAAASPRVRASPKPAGKIKVRLIPEENVGAGFHGSIRPIAHECAELRMIWAGASGRLPVADDLHRVDILHNEVTEAFSAEHLADTPR